MAKQWMKEFEQKVEAAVSELTKLRKQNASLKRQIDKLKKELSEAENAPGDLAGRRRERNQIRTRMTKVVKQLEGAL